jgi:fructose/tagatose bisphosphate aldolase
MDSLRNVLTRLEKECAALGHFNVADPDFLKAVVAAAGELKVPVLVGRPKENENSWARANSPLW